MPDDSLASPYSSLDKPVEITDSEKPITVPLRKLIMRNLGLIVTIPLIAIFLIVSLAIMIRLSANIPILHDNPVVSLFFYFSGIFLIVFIIYSKFSKS